MGRVEAEAIYDAGREAVVGVLLRMDRQIGRLEGRVERLERELARNSRNSSKPPSADPPGSAPGRPKGRSPNRQGAQVGHERRGRELLPVEAVDEVVDHWPSRCSCGHVFGDADRVAAGVPARHQVEELPVLATRVVEHRCQRALCPGCGRKRTGELPAGVGGSAFGARLQAAVATLSVRNRISRRDVVECCEQLFGARVSTGSVEAILSRTADALAAPYDGLLAQVRGAGAVNMDETGWRTAGQRRALWGMFDARHAVLAVADGRHEDHARALLADSTAIVTSDRWWAYGHLPIRRRQVCWAHPQRDFQSHAEGLGADKALGQAGLQICERLFWAWEIYQHTGDRQELKRRVRALRRELKPILATHAGKGARYRYCRRFAANLLKVWPALWTSADRPGVQPTNNHAERGLRGPVIYRKLSHGSQTPGGERRIERLLSASITCRLQRRSLYDYLAETIAAHARGDPTPNLA